MATVCSACGGTEIDYDPARGDAVCMSCGSVLEDNIIVSEVNFQETSGGGSAVIGQFVSADEGAASGRLGAATGFSRGFNRESREITLQKGHQRISSLGRQLQLNKRCIETAYNFFKMAVARRLTQGRKSSHVAAACLYLVCRTEGTPHLLLDFSDRLQVNVYILGRCYLKLANALCINAPAVDPCLYVHRFASRLEFGDKTHEVSMTALRLVSRMKRDWIHHGRRPSGLCGAALLVAARLHNFSRTIRDIIRVVRICEPTLRKRLEEFEKTPSGQLTIDEFLKIDLEEESDPPSFIESRKKAKAQSDKAKDKDSSTDDSQQQLAELAQVEDQINQILESSIDAEALIEPSTFGLSAPAQRSVSFSDTVSTREFDVEHQDEDITSTLSDAALTDCLAGQGDVLAAALGNDITSLSDWAASLAGGDEDEDGVKEGEEEVFEDIDDGELDGLILAPEEVAVKTKMWMTENGDYLAEQEEKHKREELEREKNKDKPPKKPRKRKPKAPMKQCKTAGEAIEHMLQTKKISNKINYEVLKDLTSSVPAVPTPTHPHTAPTPTAASSWLMEEEKRDIQFSAVLDEGLLFQSSPKRLRTEAVGESQLGEAQIVETGPVECEEDEQELGDYEHDDEGIQSAAQLLGHEYDNDFEEEDYLDEF